MQFRRIIFDLEYKIFDNQLETLKKNLWCVGKLINNNFKKNIFPIRMKFCVQLNNFIQEKS